jgi:hypothetical protein
MRTTLASDAVIDQAYQWLCHQRRHWHANALDLMLATTLKYEPLP